MEHINSSDATITATVLDALMQDTWLLAPAARNGQSTPINDALYQHCFDMIEQVQDQLSSAGASSHRF